jgi:hypothetical protein
MTQVIEAVNSSKEQLTNKALKEALYKELELQTELTVHGISAEPEDLRALNLVPVTRERVSIQSLEESAVAADVTVPGSAITPTTIELPYGLSIGFNYTPGSPYGLVAENGKPVLYRYGKKATRLVEVEFRKRSKNPLSEWKTSDGVPFKNIARLDPITGLVHVSFSKECSLKDKGEECLFCHYDNRKAIIKTPQQVGEVFAAAVDAGLATSLHLTGGFTPERRELENYIDVAEAIKSRTGLKTFNGSISMGAPQDYSVFDKFKEAGWSLIGSNMEIWDKNVRQTLAPGKQNQCGGYDNWVNSLIYAARVFGKGKVFSNIIGGLEPKKNLLEGVEFLVARNVVGNAGIFRPTPGSGLEGHQSPEASWHLDVAHKVYEIYRKYGLTLDEIQSYHSQGSAAGTIYRIEEEYFENGKIKRWTYPTLVRPEKAAV